jgi:hypothetical protein
MVFPKLDVPALLGVTPISGVTDETIWNELVTPQVKALLGDIISVEPTRIMESTQGLFPGDDVSNLNAHQLHGQTGLVRFPYLHTLYRTRNGAFVVKRDGVKFKGYGWFGDVSKGRAKLIYQVSLRDRRYDGSRRANDTALLDFPYDDARFNLPNWHGSTPLLSVETSLYSFFPGSLIAAAMGDKELEDFVASPYRYVDRPELFLRFFWQMWRSERAPGMIGSVIPDVGKLIPPAWERVALAAGYDMLETAPSHIHVVLWNVANGLRYVDPRHEQIVAGYVDGIDSVRKRGVKLTRTQESWLCVLQNLRPASAIPAELRFDVPVQPWPQDNIGPENLWLFKPLSTRAKALLAEKK